MSRLALELNKDFLKQFGGHDFGKGAYRGLSSGANSQTKWILEVCVVRKAGHLLCFIRQPETQTRVLNTHPNSGMEISQKRLPLRHLACGFGTPGAKFVKEKHIGKERH